MPSNSTFARDSNRDLSRFSSRSQLQRDRFHIMRSFDISNDDVEEDGIDIILIFDFNMCPKKVSKDFISFFYQSNFICIDTEQLS